MAKRNNYPIKLEKWYANKLKKLVRQWNVQASFYIQNYINPLVKGGKNLLSDDDTSKGFNGTADQLNQAIKMMLDAMSTADNEYEFNSLAKRFIYAVDEFSFKNVKFQTAIKGIDPISDNPALRDYVTTKIAENVSLIQK